MKLYVNGMHLAHEVRCSRSCQSWPLPYATLKTRQLPLLLQWLSYGQPLENGTDVQRATKKLLANALKTGQSATIVFLGGVMPSGEEGISRTDISYHNIVPEESDVVFVANLCRDKTEPVLHRILARIALASMMWSRNDRQKAAKHFRKGFGIRQLIKLTLFRRTYYS